MLTVLFEKNCKLWKYIIFLNHKYGKRWSCECQLIWYEMILGGRSKHANIIDVKIIVCLLFISVYLVYIMRKGSLFALNLRTMYFLFE